METKIEKINGKQEVVIKQGCQSFILQKIQNVDFTKEMFDTAIKSFISEINMKKSDGDENLLPLAEPTLEPLAAIDEGNKGKSCHAKGSKVCKITCEFERNECGHYY